MAIFSPILTALLSINALFDVSRNIKGAKEDHQRHVSQRNGRIRHHAAAHKLEKIGGPGTKVRPGRSGSGEWTLVVEKWPSTVVCPTHFDRYPVTGFAGRKRTSISQTGLNFDDPDFVAPEIQGAFLGNLWRNPLGDNDEGSSDEELNYFDDLDNNSASVSSGYANYFSSLGS